MGAESSRSGRSEAAPACQMKKGGYSLSLHASNASPLVFFRREAEVRHCRCTEAHICSNLRLISRMRDAPIWSFSIAIKVK